MFLTLKGNNAIGDRGHCARGDEGFKQSMNACRGVSCVIIWHYHNVCGWDLSGLYKCLAQRMGSVRYSGLLELIVVSEQLD